ncbi:hypothetical protein CAP35_03370 [Chitinophagaceae bacterium IBVUCB1]|nr:hypothetical protein CAP35_03370 [Chitinophagaceae bacterium IBVUCB1]
MLSVVLIPEQSDHLFMKLKLFIPAILASASLLTASCGGEQKTEDTLANDTVAVAAAVELTDFSASPEYPDAQLGFGDIKTTAQGTDSVKIDFSFDVKNYELGSQTADAAGKLCNNSDKGQHIHFILDNKPYAALYKPTHSVVVPKNSEHYLLIFLARSYHESIKTKGASAMLRFKIDEKGKLQKMEAPATPMVFYSRPKGDYIGKNNTDNLLLDFYVWNGQLNDSTLSIKAQLKANGVDTTFVLKTWKPYMLKNVPLGKPSITLTLVDKDGNKATGDNTEVTREFNLAADEPLK